MKRIIYAVVCWAAVFIVFDAAAQQRGLFGRNRPLTQAPQQAAKPLTSAATPAKAAETPKGEHALNWNGAASDILLQAYGDAVEKTVLKDPTCPSAVITLKSKEGQKLTREEYLEAIEMVLEMNQIHLEPYGDRFLLALPRKEARKSGIPLIMDPEHKVGESGRVISMMIPFKNIMTDEAQKALEGLKSPSGLLLVFERTNSILVTDTEQNINRMLEIVRSIDVATPANENVFVRQIKNASAAEIKTALEAIVQDSQKEQEKNKSPVKTSGVQNTQRPSGVLGLRRNQPQQQPASANNESLVTSVSDADRGMIRGKVLILSDERSNKLIIVTSKPNMDFFDKVIEQLDIETTPDTVVKVYRLKYADAEDVSDMINDLIGNASSSKGSSKNNQNQNAKKGSNVNTTTGRQQTPGKSANQRTGDAKAGELSKDNTTVLADKRINGLVVMTNKELVPVVEQIIESMDIKLSQVLIETAIIEVGLGKDLATGIDWVRGMQRNAANQYQSALGGGGGSASAVSIGSGTNLFDTITGETVSPTLPSFFSPGGAGLSYAVFSKGLDLAAVISMSQSDNTSKYIASPIVMTVDNKEATIEATESRKFLSGYQSNNSSSSYYGSSIVPQYEGKDIGIKIKVTPKINPNGTVMLEVEEEYSQVGAKQTIQDPNSKPVDIDTSLTRKMAADVVLENRQTVVLGGLTDTSTSTSEAGIPILKDIPWIGKYLFGRTANSETRSELLVFLTPYVLSDGQDAEAEALRRKQSLSDSRPWEDHGWSKSKLADPVSAKEKLRRLKQEWKKQDEEHKTTREIDKQNLDRAKALKERAEQEEKEDEERKQSEKEAEEEENRQKAVKAAEDDPLLKKLLEETK